MMRSFRPDNVPLVIIRSYGRPLNLDGPGATADFLESHGIPFMIALCSQDPHFVELLMFYSRHAPRVVWGPVWTQRITRFLLLAVEEAGIDYIYIVDDNISWIKATVRNRMVPLSSHQLMSMLKEGEKQMRASGGVAVSLATSARADLGNARGSPRTDAACARSRDLPVILDAVKDSHGVLHGAFVGYSTSLLQHAPYNRYQQGPNCRDDVQLTVCLHCLLYTS